MHNLRHIYLEKPRQAAGRCPYLCLKVRSKLKVPVEELGLTKVAKIENDSDYLTLNEFSVITLKVRFTTRPRVVFQKQSDMMILIVALKRGDQVLCSDESELIFRGGTGSIHSADSRKSSIAKEIHPPHCAPQMMSSQMSHLPGEQAMMQQPYAPIAYDMSMQPYASLHPEPLVGQNPGVNPCVNGSYQDTVWSDIGTEFEATNYLSEPPIFGASPGDVWVPPQQQQQQQPPKPTFTEAQFSQMKTLELLQNSERPIDEINVQELSMLVSQSEFTFVHNKKRGFCCDCMSECLFYRGCGGPCGECGCFPSAHIDLDRPIDYNKKRLSIGGSPQPSNKRPRTF